ncbi:uncharacterized protein BXZ73DRAFT_110874 [Epithele typhae]|uniref:uncharacterized protein n=1 Tax=Epithele typhae TaxID=378194 RepID=UPI002007C697|nr:uncharacterized protein BXZ73DRAFT_110874 [Epithele typhae]KAH9905528.1 hypothetical protein BXZ73DRAFT_110874 [Epithele typhae]
MSRSSAATSSNSMGTFARLSLPSLRRLWRRGEFPTAMSKEPTPALHGLVPVDYRRQLADPLRDIATLAEKLEKARSSTSRLHGSCRTVGDVGGTPHWLRVNVRDLQAYKDFLAATPEESASRLARLETLRAEYEKALVGEGVRLLKDETPVLARWKVLAADCQVPVIEFVKNRTTDGDVVMEDGELLTSRFRLEDRPVSNIEFEALATRRRKAEKKKAVVAEANIKPPTSHVGASIQSLIDKAVNARMKAYSQYKPGQSSKGGVAVRSRTFRLRRSRSPHPRPRESSHTQERREGRNKKAAAAKAAAKTAPAKQKASGNKDQKGKGKARK